MIALNSDIAGLFSPTDTAADDVIAAAKAAGERCLQPACTAKTVHVHMQKVKVNAAIHCQPRLFCCLLLQVRRCGACPWRTTTSIN